MPPGVPVRVRLLWDGRDPLSHLSLPSMAGITLELVGEPERMEVAGRFAVQAYPLRLTVAAAGDVHLGSFSAMRAPTAPRVSSSPTIVHCRRADPHLVGDAWAAAEFQPHTALPGQPVQLVYRLYLRRGVDAFSAGIELPEDAHHETRGVGQQIETVLDSDGRPWTLHTLSWSLSFSTSGERRAGGSQEVISGGEREGVPIAAATISVAELPPGAPADFSGVIGALEMSVACVPQAMDADSGAVLTVTLRGADAALAPPPALDLPLGLRAYAQPAPGWRRGALAYRWDLIPEGPEQLRHRHRRAVLPRSRLPRLRPHRHAPGGARSRPRARAHRGCRARDRQARGARSHSAR